MTIIKAHVAKQPRQKSRSQCFRREAKTDPPYPPRRHGPQERQTRCSIHGLRFVEFCSECSLLVKIFTPLARHNGNSDLFDAQSIHISTQWRTTTLHLDTTSSKRSSGRLASVDGGLLGVELCQRRRGPGLNPGADLYGGLRIPPGVDGAMTSN